MIFMIFLRFSCIFVHNFLLNMVTTFIRTKFEFKIDFTLHILETEKRDFQLQHFSQNFQMYLVCIN